MDAVKWKFTHYKSLVGFIFMDFLDLAEVILFLDVLLRFEGRNELLVDFVETKDVGVQFWKQFCTLVVKSLLSSY